MVGTFQSCSKSYGHMAGVSILLALVVILSAFAGGFQNTETQVHAESHILGYLSPLKMSVSREVRVIPID